MSDYLCMNCGRVCAWLWTEPKAWYCHYCKTEYPPRPEDMKGEAMKLHVATPCHMGLAHVGYINSLLGLQSVCNYSGIEFDWDISKTESAITRNRNELVSRFLAGDATHFMFWDADIDAEPTQALRLLHSPYDVACGVYHKRADNAGFAAPEWSVGAVGADGFAPIRYAPAGFMCIKRHVFAGLGEGFGRYSGALGWARSFFENTIDPDTRQYLTEDYGFCRLCESNGIKVYVDLNSELGHTGWKRYTGDFREAVKALDRTGKM